MTTFIFVLFEDDLKTVPEKLIQQYEMAIFVVENLVKALTKANSGERLWKYLRTDSSSKEYKTVKNTILLIYNQTDSMFIKNLVLPFHILKL